MDGSLRVNESLKELLYDMASVESASWNSQISTKQKSNQNKPVFLAEEAELLLL